MTDELVIADISTGNPNVFYELAIRHASKKPVILIGQREDYIPFDIRDQRIIHYSLDPDEIEIAQKDIMEQIEEIESDNFKVDSPITDIIRIDFSDNPSSEEQVLQRILEVTENQSSRLRNIEMKLESKQLPERRDRKSEQRERIRAVIPLLIEQGYSIVEKGPREVPDLPLGKFVRVELNDLLDHAERNKELGNEEICFDLSGTTLWICINNGDE